MGDHYTLLRQAVQNRVASHGAELLLAPIGVQLQLVQCSTRHPLAYSTVYLLPLQAIVVTTYRGGNFTQTH